MWSTVPSSIKTLLSPGRLMMMKTTTTATRLHSSLGRRTWTSSARVGGGRGASGRATAWSGSLSFASPETDFSTVAWMHHQDLHDHHHHHQRVPERNLSHGSTTPKDWSNALSFASPESDFTMTLPQEMVRRKKTTRAVVSHTTTLSFASPESDWTAQQTYAHASDDIEWQLPTTLQQALMMEEAPLVVTTAYAPHAIVHVNKAWERLCGYTKQEALHKTLPELIQGPDTNQELARGMIQQLQQTKQPQDAYLVNYHASGRPFINHIRVGPLHQDPVPRNTVSYSNKNDHNEAHMFMVGILQEVAREKVPLRLIISS